MMWVRTHYKQSRDCANLGSEPPAKVNTLNKKRLKFYELSLRTYSVPYLLAHGHAP